MAETAAIELIARLAGEFGARVHIVHVSAAESIEVLRRARARGVAITAETCPHYLTFSAEEIGAGATELKCAPPIRSDAHRAALWEALVRRDIDLVVSDHSPCPPSLKRRDTGDFFAAWGGISSLQLGLSVISDGAHARGIALERIAQWMSANPARLVGLDGRKGEIGIGRDADIVVWDPNQTTPVRAEALYHRHKLTPYLGRTLRGRVRATIVGGRFAFSEEGMSATPTGRLLTRQTR